MKNIALIFPGQGVQKVGMGREFYDASPAARAVFDRANTIVDGLLDVIFNGPDEKLVSTAYCQPAIFTTSVAALEAFKVNDKFRAVTIRYAAGLSLGEYSALCAAGSIAFEDCLRLVQKRAAFMEGAARMNPGKMAAVIGLDKERLADIVAAAGCEVANYNAPDQIVITGHAAAVEQACRLIAEAGGGKAIPLDVGGAFHSSLMKPAADRFAGALKDVVFRVFDVKIVTNVNARPQASSDEIRVNLAAQICSSVQWVDSVSFIASQGIMNFIEVGPGRVLKGLIRKINPALNVQNVQTPQDLDALIV